MKKINPGIIFAIIAGITYGTNPFFAELLEARDFNVDTILFLRYLPAALILALFMLFKKTSFRMNLKECAGMLICGILFICTSFFLYSSFRYIDVGIASTLLFVYPVIVAPIMTIFFREKFTLRTLFCLILACGGVGCLCRTSGGELVNMTGFAAALLSAASYGLYLVALNKIKWIQNISSDKQTFYVLCCCTLFFFFRVGCGTALTGTMSVSSAFLVLGLAMIPTVLSLGFTSLAIQRVGATITSIVGALEPLTGVCIGLLLFGEKLTTLNAVGIAMIISSVIIIALKKD